MPYWQNTDVVLAKKKEAVKPFVVQAPCSWGFCMFGSGPKNEGRFGVCPAEGDIGIRLVVLRDSVSDKEDD